MASPMRAPLTPPTVSVDSPRRCMLCLLHQKFQQVSKDLTNTLLNKRAPDLSGQEVQSYDNKLEKLKKKMKFLIERVHKIRKDISQGTATLQCGLKKDGKGVRQPEVRSMFQSALENDEARHAEDAESEDVALLRYVEERLGRAVGPAGNTPITSLSPEQTTNNFSRPTAGHDQHRTTSRGPNRHVFAGRLWVAPAGFTINEDPCPTCERSERICANGFPCAACCYYNRTTAERCQDPRSRRTAAEVDDVEVSGVKVHRAAMQGARGTAHTGRRNKLKWKMGQSTPLLPIEEDDEDSPKPSTNTDPSFKTGSSGDGHSVDGSLMSSEATQSDPDINPYTGRSLAGRTLLPTAPTPIRTQRVPNTSQDIPHETDAQIASPVVQGEESDTSHAVPQRRPLPARYRRGPRLSESRRDLAEEE